MYIADDIKNWDSQAEINGKWVLARPLPYYGFVGLVMRISDAYKVLTGKADAVRWIGQ
jgi:hypothetical protein